MIRIFERLIYPVFFLTLVVGLAYWYWTTTPSYALSQIVVSVKNRDPETFEKYVDIESIVFRAIDDLLHGPARESGVFGNMDNMVGVGIIGLFKPEIAEIARSQILKFISQGKLSEDLSEQPSNSLPSHSVSIAPVTSNYSTQTNPINSFPSHRNTAESYAQRYRVKQQLAEYGISREGFKGVDYLKTQGPMCLVGLKFHSPKLNRDFIVELKMEDAGGYWRITELSNLNDLISQYLETRGEFGSFNWRFDKRKISLTKGFLSLIQ